MFMEPSSYENLIVGVLHCELTIPELAHIARVACQPSVSTAEAKRIRVESYLQQTLDRLRNPQVDVHTIYKQYENSQAHRQMAVHDTITDFLKGEGVPHGCKMCAADSAHPVCPPLQGQLRGLLLRYRIYADPTLDPRLQ